jgi:uncharacterized protein YjdB
MKMLGAKRRSSIAKAVVVLMVMMTLFASVPTGFNQDAYAGSEPAAVNADDLALQAIAANYDFFMNGTSVDGSWGNFSSYDAYILAEAGVDLDAWMREGETESFEDMSIALMDATLAAELDENIDNMNDKRVAQDYVGAVSLREADRAEDLLAILVSRQANDLLANDGWTDLPVYDMLNRVGNLEESGLDLEEVVQFIQGCKNAPVEVEPGVFAAGWPADWPDLMSTVEAMRVLDTLKDNYEGAQLESIQSDIDEGIEWLKLAQQEDGSYLAGFDEKFTNTPEMIYTMNLMDSEAFAWVSDEEGEQTPVDYMLNLAVSEGCFEQPVRTTWGLDGYLQLGASVPSDSALGLTLNEEDEELFEGDEIDLTATALTVDGLENVSSKATWTSDDEDVAVVDSDGILTAVGDGEVAITVEYQNYSDSISLYVWNSPTPLVLQAIRANYDFFMDGTLVDASWGQFSSYDAYILAEAGVDLDTWVREGETESFEDMSIALMDATLAAELDENIDNMNDKRVAQDYVGAVSFGETDRAEDLLAILVNRQANELLANDGYTELPFYDMLNRVGDLEESGLDLDEVVQFIQGCKNAPVEVEPGVFAAGWPDGWPDLMSTVEAMRVLDTLKDNYEGAQLESIQSDIDEGIEWLKLAQQEDGSFLAGFDDKAFNTPEMIYTLNVMDPEAFAWVSDEEGENTPKSYMLNTAISEGGLNEAAKATWSLDGYLQLGANVPSDSALTLTIDEESEAINVGDEISLTVTAMTINGLENVSGKVNWSSDDEDVAVVDSDGKVIAIGDGEVEISVDYQDLNATIEFIVKETPSSLAGQAIAANYDFFMNGTSVDGSWGNFSSYDAYILAEAGVDLDAWMREGETESFEDMSIALMDATLAAELDENIDNMNDKRVAQDYVGAVSFDETDRAEDLLAILVSRQANDLLANDGWTDLPVYDMLNRVGNLEESGLDFDEVVQFIQGCKNAPVEVEPGVFAAGWPADWPDLMSTVEAMRVLDTLKVNYEGAQLESIQSDIDEGIEWLKLAQQEDGSYLAGFDEKFTNTPEMIYTMNLMDSEAFAWVSDEEGEQTPEDYMLNLAVSEGCFEQPVRTTWALDGYLQLGAKVIQYVDVTPSEKSITEGKTTQFNAQVIKLDGTTIEITDQATWTSSDEDVARVDENGEVKAMNPGIATITAIYEGVSGFGTLTVKNEDPDDEYEVVVVIIDEDGDIIYGPKDVDVSENDEYEGSAVSALDATRVDWEYSDEFPGMVVEIDGIRNSGMSGWMYAVNGRVPSVLPIDKSVDDSDEVMFWYSTDSEADAPDWPESETVESVEVLVIDKNAVKELLESYGDQLEQLTEGQLNLNADKVMTEEEIVELEAALEGNEVDLSGRVLEARTLIADQEVMMLVTENALGEPATIKIQELDPEDSPKQFAVNLGSSTYEFSPNGIAFDKDVTIAIKVIIDEDTDLDALTPAWFDEETNQWVSIPCIIDVENGLVIFKIDHFTKFAIVQLEKRIMFGDVNEGIAWAKDPIEILAGHGIISGTGNGFEPMRTITRAEYITLVVKAMGIELTESKGRIFTDIDASHWYSDAVETGFNSGIVSGDTDGSFRPNDIISRNEVAVILSNLEESTSGQNLYNLTFTDSTEVPAWALSGVKFVAREGLMIGSGDNKFRGSNALSRAEAAVVIYSYLNRFSK